MNASPRKPDEKLEMNPQLESVIQSLNYSEEVFQSVSRTFHDRFDTLKKWTSSIEQKSLSVALQQTEGAWKNIADAISPEHSSELSSQTLYKLISDLKFAMDKLLKAYETVRDRLINLFPTPGLEKDINDLKNIIKQAVEPLVADSKAVVETE